MTQPTLDEVTAALTGVLGPVSLDYRPQHACNREVDWRYRRGYVVAGLRFDGVPLVWVRHHRADADPDWLVTRDGAPIDGDDTVTLDALPGLVRASVEQLGLGEAVTT